MAFIRTKQQHGHTYYYLVENRREGGKVRQKVIVYLGRHATVAAALEETQRRIGIFKRLLQQGTSTVSSEHTQQEFRETLQQLEERYGVLQAHMKEGV